MTSRDDVHFLRARDGVALTLIRVVGPEEPTRGPVILVHGAATRAEFFRPRRARSLVDALQGAGWDVWLLNWRGSIDLDPLPWTIDDVATGDIPAAVDHVVAVTGAPRVRIVAHCAGAAAVSVAAVAGLIPAVDVVVANGVALTPRVPRWARVKLSVLRPIAQGSQPYVDIAWGDGPEKGIHRITRNVVRLWHAECRNPTCNMASFALGSGHPALWRHQNLTSGTHEWLRTEFGKVPLSFYNELALSVRAGEWVRMSPHAPVPERAASTVPQTDARFVLLTGAHNRVYLPASQRATHAMLERHQPRRHTLTVLPDYGHADVFVGARAHSQVFPRILAELAR